MAAKKSKKAQLHPALIGLVQATLEMLYIALVATFMIYGGFDGPAENEVLNIMMALLLFVFSAVMSALIVLGYPVHLALKGDVKRALYIVGYTALFFFVFIFIGAFTLRFF